MIIHYYYNIGKLLYSFITNRNKKFLILEVCGVLLTLIIVFLFDSNVKEQFIKQSSNQEDLRKILVALFYSILFFFTGLASRFISDSNPDEATLVKFSKKKDKKKKNDSPSVYVGIIDFSWLSVMSITYGGLLYVLQYDAISGTIPSNFSKDYYNLYYDEIKYLLQESINVAIILGTILAACMAILWGEAIWRNKGKKKKKNEKTINDYKGTTLAAMKMIIAYFIIVFSELVWISLPLYLKLTRIKEFINNT